MNADDRTTDTAVPVTPVETAPAPARRGLLTAAAIAALAAGVGAAWWRHQPGPADATGFWSLSLPRPGGPPLAMASLRGQPLLVNFWATWCPPCVEEMSLLDRFHAEHEAAGWRVLGVAVDKEDAVQRFLARTPVRFPVVLAGLGGTDVSRDLGNANGGLPYSVLFDRNGSAIERKIGQLHESDLKAWRSRA